MIDDNATHHEEIAAKTETADVRRDVGNETLVLESAKTQEDAAIAPPADAAYRAERDEAFADADAPGIAPTAPDETEDDKDDEDDDCDEYDEDDDYDEVYRPLSPTEIKRKRLRLLCEYGLMVLFALGILSAIASVIWSIYVHVNDYGKPAKSYLRQLTNYTHCEADAEGEIDSRTYRYLTETDEDAAALYACIYYANLDFGESERRAKKMYGRRDYCYGYVHYAEYGVDGDLVKAVWSNVRVDNPQFYWMDMICIEGYLYLTTSADYAKPADRARCNAEVRALADAAAGLHDEAYTDLDKCKAIHDYIIRNMAYARDENGEPERALWSGNLIGFLEKGKGVCMGYAATFTYLARCVGVETTPLLLKNKDDKDSAHIFNLVRIEGRWYGVDVTNCDTLDTYTLFCFGEGTFHLYYSQFEITADYNGFYIFDPPKLAPTNYPLPFPRYEAKPSDSVAGAA